MFGDDISINTIVGAGSKLVGNLNLGGFVRVDGDVDGSLSTPGRVFIGKDARIRGNVAAKAAVIGGIVLGDVLAPEGVLLHATAAVIGDISTRLLEVAEGVIFHGHCISLSTDGAYSSAMDRWKDVQTIRERSGSGSKAAPPRRTTPVANAAPVAGDAPVANAAPVTGDAAVANAAPAAGDAAVANAAPAAGDAPVANAASAGA
jgi:cytoskeletal protein CcmA (bactofilin family)